MTSQLQANSESIEFSATQIGKVSTIVLNNDISKVFPLFGPVREMEWAEGWAPRILYGSSEVSEHMIFHTLSPDNPEEIYLWVITKYKPELHQIEYTVSAGDRVWFISVACAADGMRTRATIGYKYIALTKEAHQVNERALTKMFVSDLADWEKAINYYLATGRMLRNATLN